MTGRAIFSHKGEVLEVITANQRPLEECFGVDLVYLNSAKRNLVMVQYKMLEQISKDWIYRPDQQLDDEVQRMKYFAQLETGSPEEFRLHSGMFYLKLVKRNGPLKEGGIVLPLDHFMSILDDPAAVGPRGGIRVSYQSLGGSYLRRQPFVDLIRAGYIGSHSGTTNMVQSLIDQIVRGNRSVVAAIQRSMARR